MTQIIEPGPVCKPAAVLELPQRVHPLDLLFERSCTMRERVMAGQVAFLDAVDAMYSAADWAGLVEHYGDDLIQEILAEAFIGTSRGQP